MSEPEKILVVDDDEDLLRMMVIALQRTGNQVESAVDGFTALHMLRYQGPFAVLLTDLMMPGMSGLELLRAARQLDTHIEIVVVTAAATLESAISALRADGAYDYLLKPFESMSQLSLAVERAAAHRRLLLEREGLQVRMQAEAERLKAVIANTGDAILSADADGVLTIANPAAVRLLGRDNLVGCIAASSLPPALAKVITNWQAVGSQYPAVIEMPWGNDSIQMVSLAPIEGGDGSSRGWVTVLRDITHLKRLDEMKVKILTEAAGQIQLPMAQAVNALAELNIAAAPDARLTETVYRLNKLWGRIKDWADDLYTLVQIDSDQGIQSTKVDLQALLDDTRKSLAEKLDRDWGLSLQLTAAPGLPMVRTDPDLLRRLLQGLVKRAAMRSGSDDEIRIKAHLNQDQVWIDVSDDGPEVSEDDLAHIFDLSFVKLNADPMNMGLELALAKTIMDRMGGQVWVGGKGPRGATITICLPAVEHPPGS